MVLAIFYYIGSILYQKGYIDPSMDVGMARYKKGGALKWIKFFTRLYSTGAFAYQLLKAMKLILNSNQDRRIVIDVNKVKRGKDRLIYFSSNRIPVYYLKCVYLI